MNERDMLERIARRHGRRRLGALPARDAAGVPGSRGRDSLGRSGEGGVGASGSEALAARFSAELEAVGGAVRHVASAAEARRALEAILAEQGPRALAAYAPEELASWELAELLSAERAEVWRGGDERAAAAFRARVAQCSVGLTSAELGVAATGTLVLACAPSRPRCVSLLPRVHVALLDAGDLRARLGEALAELVARPGGLGSGTLCVTGPSRTSDIENDLTIGVHGPAAVIVILRHAAAVA